MNQAPRMQPNADLAGATPGEGNNSGLGADPPPGVKGWSWGAFLSNWIWAIFNRTWIGLLSLIPVIGFFAAIYLGIKGRELAWRNKRWESLDHFNRVQRRWSMWSLILTLVAIVIGIAQTVATNALLAHPRPDQSNASGGVEAAQSPSQPAASEAPGEVPEAWKTHAVVLMNKAYGAYDAKLQCWLKKHDLGEGGIKRYCMRVVDNHWGPAAADGGPTRLYLLAAGSAVDEKGRELDVHALPGLVGAFVAERQGDTMALLAGNARLEVGNSGAPPNDWQFYELGTSLYGWVGTTGDCQQGFCTRRVLMLVPRGNAISDVGFQIAFSNGGACNDAGCEAQSSDLELNVETDQNSPDTPLHALRATITGKLDGAQLPGKTFLLPFNAAKWAYTFPNDPAIERLFTVP